MERQAGDDLIVGTSATRPPEAARQRSEGGAHDDVAKPIAHVPDGERAAHETRIKFVEFRLANESYGIEPKYIRVIAPLRRLTPIPCTPEFVLGVTNLHGEIVSVIDPKKLLQLPDQDLTNLSDLIVLQFDGMTFGIPADSVETIRSVAPGEIRPVPRALSRSLGKYLRGVVDNRLAILDAERLLSDMSLVVHEEVGKRSGAGGREGPAPADTANGS